MKYRNIDGICELDDEQLLVAIKNAYQRVNATSSDSVVDVFFKAFGEWPCGKLVEGNQKHWLWGFKDGNSFDEIGVPSSADVDYLNGFLSGMHIRSKVVWLLACGKLTCS